MYTYGDGSDTLQQFVRGPGGDAIAFSGIAAIDLITISTRTEFRASDGIAGNPDGTEELLVSMQGTTGLSAAANISDNLPATNTAQFWFT